jgi:uncharacterized Zn finger protein (UPF0148 family)
VAITRIECPECGAGLKSAAGFEEGQTVECPKCETNFSVEEPVRKSTRNEDDEDDRPRKRKKKRSDDDESERSYKNSPMRFAVLGVLVVVMIVLGIMLVVKKKRESEADTASNDEAPPANANPPGNGLPIAARGAGGLMPPGGPPPFKGANPPGKQFGTPNQPPPGGKLPIGDLFGGAVTPAETAQIQAKLSTKLLGVWEGAAPDGSTHKVTYQAGGMFTHNVAGTGKDSASAGAWRVTGLLGNKGLKLNRGNDTVKVVFEDDELIHDTATPGQTVVLRKK